FIHGETGGELVRRMHDHGKSVQGNGDLDELDPVCRTVLPFVLPDGSRSSRQVQLTVAEAAESASGSGEAHREADPLVEELELFREGLGHGVDGGGSVDL